MMAPDAELVLETLVIEDSEDSILVPRWSLRTNAKCLLHTKY